MKERLFNLLGVASVLASDADGVLLPMLCLLVGVASSVGVVTSCTSFCLDSTFASFDLNFTLLSSVFFLATPPAGLLVAGLVISEAPLVGGAA